MLRSSVSSSSRRAEDRFSTGCNWARPSVSSTTYRVVESLPMITLRPGSSQFSGTAGRNMPQAPNPARISAPTTAPGRTARSGRGAPSSVTVGAGCRNAETVRRLANV